MKLNQKHVHSHTHVDDRKRIIKPEMTNGESDDETEQEDRDVDPALKEPKEPKEPKKPRKGKGLAAKEKAAQRQVAAAQQQAAAAAKRARNAGKKIGPGCIRENTDVATVDISDDEDGTMAIDLDGIDPDSDDGLSDSGEAPNRQPDAIPRKSSAPFR